MAERRYERGDARRSTWRERRRLLLQYRGKRGGEIRDGTKIYAKSFAAGAQKKTRLHVRVGQIFDRTLLVGRQGREISVLNIEGQI